MSHPNSLDLEAFACGEPRAVVASHLESCDACGAFVAQIKTALAAPRPKLQATDKGAKRPVWEPRGLGRSPKLQATDKDAKRPVWEPRGLGRSPMLKATDKDAKRPVWEPRGLGRSPMLTPPATNVVSLAERRAKVRAAAWVVVPLVAAAVLLLVLRPGEKAKPVAEITPVSVSPPPAPPPDPTPSEAPLPQPIALATPEPSPISFKGALPIAIVRERAGDQKRFVGSVSVKPDDRLRVEVALDREEVILAGVLGDDGSWLELMPPESRTAGTYFSDRSARVDASPLRGTVLVGPPTAVTLARTTHRFDGVSSLRIDWESQ